jgi:DNA-binding NarL/FixJ family response regulator
MPRRIFRKRHEMKIRQSAYYQRPSPASARIACTRIRIAPRYEKQSTAAAYPLRCGSRTAPTGESRLKLLLVENHGVELTQRQAEVLALLVQGKPNKIISRELGLAQGTVKIHVTAILRKLKVSNRTQAALTASRFVVSSGDSSDYATSRAIATTR